MTYIRPEIALVTHDDIAGILNLQEQNLLERGGLLSVRLPSSFIVAALDDLPYGPTCVAENERGHGLAEAMFAKLREHLPARECVAFVRRDNVASLRAHLKMGMRDLASFAHGGATHAVLAFSMV